jgi:hypothetical protein
MSETKLGKFLQLPRKSFTGTKHITPEFISDSKGIYLKNQIQYREEHIL